MRFVLHLLHTLNYESKIEKLVTTAADWSKVKTAVFRRLSESVEPDFEEDTLNPPPSPMHTTCMQCHALAPFEHVSSLTTKHTRLTSEQISIAKQPSGAVIERSRQGLTMGNTRNNMRY